MRKRSMLTVVLALAVLLAFSAVCVAAPAVVVNGKAIAAKPDAKGMISAKAVFTALGCKVAISKKNVMTVTRGKDVVTITAKAITKNKKPVKKTVVKAVKGDYLIPYSLVTALFGIKATFDAKTLTVTIGAAPAAAPPAKTEPAKTEPAKTEPAKTEPAKPDTAGLEGTKADAYLLLKDCKFSGNGAGNNWDIMLKDLPLGVGDMPVTATTKTTGQKTKLVTKGVKFIFGGDADETIPVVPFYEIVNGDKDDIVKFLKSADSITVAGNVITIGKATPPASLITLLNKVNSKMTWSAPKLDMSCKITVDNGAVKAISITKMTGTAHGATGGDHPITLTVDLTF